MLTPLHGYFSIKSGTIAYLEKLMKGNRTINYDKVIYFMKKYPDNSGKSKQALHAEK